MAIGYFTKGELKRQQQQEQQNYVDKVVLPNAIRQQSSVVQNLSDFGSGKLQDYQTAASLPSEIQSYRQNLVALQNNGYDLGDTTELYAALSGAQKEIKNWLSKYPTESDYYNGYYYPMKYRQADRKGINDTIHGLQQQLAGTKKGSAEAKRLQSEIDWLNGNQYSYWSIDELKKHLDTLENRAPGMEASKNQVDRYKADYAAAEDAYKRGKWAEAYEKMGAEGRYAFSNLENWEDTIKKAEGAGRSYVNNRYDKVVADNGNDVAYYYKGTKELVKDRDERKYAEAITGSEDFTHLMRTQGFSDAEIKALRQQAQEQRNAEKAIQKMQKAADYINSHGFGGGLAASLLSVPESLISGLPAAVDQTAQTLASAFGKPNAITGRPDGVDPNRFFSRMAQHASTIRGTQADELSEIGPEWVGNSLSFLYNTGMSIADFVVADKFGKLLAGAAKATGLATTGEAAAKTVSRAPMTLLGGAAATQTMADARARGATDDQATTLGILAGLAETVFETFSLEKLDLFRTSSRNALRYTIKEGLKDIGSQAFYEGSEELFTTLANTLSDLIVMGDKNAIQQDILKFMQEDGMSKEDATREAWKSWAGQLGLDALAGALSGAFISGAEVGKSAVINKEVGDLIFIKGGTLDLINEALALDPNSNAYKLAQDLSTRIDATTGSATKELKSADVGRLAFMVQQAQQEQRENLSVAEQMPRTHQAVQQTQSGRTEVATVLSTTAESLMSQGMTAPEAARIAPTVESLLAGERISNSQLNSIMRNPVVAAVVQERTGVEIDIKATSAELRRVYRSVEKTQAEKIQNLDNEAKVIQDEQTALVDEQIAVQSDANDAAERMMLDSMALEQNQAQTAPAGANAGQGAASDSDVVELLNDDGTVNQMTRAEFRESARQAGSNESDAQLNAQFDMLLARYRFENQPIRPELSRASAAAAGENAPAAEGETGQGTEQTAEGEGETARAPVDTEDAPDGITFRAKEGGVKELTREQNWAAALAYRVLRPFGVKRIIWDEAHCTEFGRASINVGNGTIYLNPAKLRARDIIFRAIGHEITHPATDDNGSKVNPMAEQIINSVQEIAKRGMFRDAAKRGADAEVAIQKIREEMLAAAAEHEVSGRADLAKQIREEAEKLVPEDILWQAENLGEVRKSIIDRYRNHNLTLAARAEAAGNTALAEEYRQNAANFDEHMANQEIAGDWIGMLLEYPELLERFAGESPKGIQRIIRSLNKMRFGSGIKVLSGQDRKDAEKMLDKLIDEVNGAVKKSKLRAFQPSDESKRKPRSKKATAKVEERIKSRQDRVAEAQARVAERAKAQREAAGEEITKPASQERNMFVGEKSRLADTEALRIAQEMEKQGKNADQIRIVTGWFRGADNRWRYEIADNKMNLRTKGSARIYNMYPEYREFSDLELRVINGETLSEAEQARMNELGEKYIPLRKEMNKAARKAIREGTATLSDVLVHPELFEAYPELANMRVHFHKFTQEEGGMWTGGFFDPNDFHIEINTDAWGVNNAKMRRTLAHEVQHAVQHLEDFATGGNPGWWGDRRAEAAGIWKGREGNLRNHFPSYYGEWKSWKQAYDTGDTEAMHKIEKRVAKMGNRLGIENFQKAIGAYQLANDTRDDFELYEDTAGEREARNTANRLERTGDQRLRERPDLGENPTFTEEPFKYRPTKDPKVKTTDVPATKERFQLDAPVEYTKDLVAMHNATIRGLMRYLRDGGMPAPSIAIIRDNMLHKLFGDFSIILNRSSIDPEADSRNHVWAGDAWTPTGQNVMQEWGLDEEAAKDWFNRFKEAIGYTKLVNMNQEDAQAVRDMQNTIYQLETDGPEQLAHDTAYPLHVAKPEEHAVAAYRAMLVGDLREQARQASKDAELMAYINEALNLYNPNNPVGRDIIEDMADTLDKEFGTNFTEQVNNGEYDALHDFLKAARASSADIEPWLVDQFNSMLDGRHDIILDHGYSEEVVPYNAKNFVKAMYLDGNRRSVNTFPGDYTDAKLDGWQSAAIHELHDVQQMHDYEGRLLQDHDAHEAALNRLSDSIVRFVDDTTRNRTTRGRLSSWDVAEVLADNSELTTAEEVKDAFSDYGVKLSDEQANMALEVYKRLAELPQQYYEAKPERVVGLNEMKAIIAPRGARQDVLDQFRVMGIPVIEYANDEERRDALNHPAVKSERFQLESPVEYTPTLIALHNLDEKGLRRYFDEGFIPTASVAIVPTKMGHSGYGNYTVVLGRDDIDPERNPAAQVWAGDSWTPQRDDVKYSYKVPEDVKSRLSNVLFRAGIDADVRDRIIKNLGTGRAYFPLDPLGSAARELAKVIRPDLEEEIDEAPDITAVELAMETRLALEDYLDSEEKEDYVILTDFIRDLDNETGSDFAKHAKKKANNPTWADLEEYCRGIVDSARLIENIVLSYFDDIQSEIRRTAERQITSQNIQTGETRSYPYSPDNLAKAMEFRVNGDYRAFGQDPWEYKGGDIDGFLANAIPELNNVTEMHEIENRLKHDYKAYDQARTDLVNAISNFVNSVLPVSERPTRSYEYSEPEKKLVTVLAKTASMSDSEAIKQVFSGAGYDLNDQQVAKALKVSDALAKIPHHYFEAKIKNAFPISRIRAVIAPENAPTDLVKKIWASGIEVIPYVHGNEQSRLAAVNDPSLVGDRFQVNAPLADQIRDAIKKGTPNEVVGYGRTTPALQAVGLDDVRLLMWKTHLKQMTRPKHQYGNIHAHGITEEQANQLPKELERPVLIFDAPTKNVGHGGNTVGVVTSMLDPDGLPIIAYVSDRGDFASVQLNEPDLTQEEVAAAGAIRSAYGYGKKPDTVQQPTPTDAGLVDEPTFTKLMLDALENDDVLFVNHERLRALESAMVQAQKNNAPGAAAGQEPNSVTGTLPSVQQRYGTEVPGGLYTLPNGTIIHKSRNLVKASPTTGNEVQRFAGPKSLAPDDPTARYQVDPNAYRRFYSDLYESRGLTPQAAAASAQARPRQRVSNFRTNTLRHADDLFTQAEMNTDGLREEDNTYDQLSNIESMRRAKERLENDYDGTINDLNSRDWRSADDLDAGMGILAVKIAEARQSHDYTDAIDWAHIVREQGTAAGQFVQAFAKYSRTPEGVLLNAVDALSQTNLSQDEQDALLDQITEFANTLHALKRGEEGDREDLIDLILRQAAVRNTKVSNQTLKDLGMQKIDYLYDAALNQMDQIAKDYIKPSLGQQLATFQTIAHLFNPKTANRNIGSNTAFNPLAAVANNVAMLPDWITGAFTGRRGVGWDKWLFSKQMWQGMAEGARTAHVELALDIDPRPNNRDKYGTARRTWKMVSNNPLVRAGSTIEKAMGFELNWTDEFHKGAIRGQILNGLEPLIRDGRITREMANAWAEQEALYRAFQDDTFANGILAIIKNGLNTMGTGRTGQYIGRLEVKEFGIGDLVQKYTQVPGALFTRAVEFSPMGYIKTIALLSQMSTANKAVAKAEAAITNAENRAARNPKNKALQELVKRAKANAVTKDAEATTAQRNFALAMGRATTGSGLIGAFALAALKGWLKRADDEDDPDAKAMMTSMGVTGTQFNISAAMRGIQGLDSKWQQGDHLVSVDFLEPMNATMTIGSLIAKEAKEDATFMQRFGNLASNNIIGLWDALQEIPTMQTLNTIQQTRQYYDKETAAVGIEPIDIAIEVARGSVTGFIPSPFRQVAQAMDTVQRDTYTSKNVWEQTADALKNALPGLREQLPAKLDNFGQPRQLEDKGLNILNATFLPGNIRTYRLSPEAEEMDRVYKATGNAGIYPDRNAPYSKSVKIDGEDVKFNLSKEERFKYQETRGQESFKLYQAMMNDPFYKQATDSEKADMLAEAKSYANYLAVKELAAGQDKDYSNAKYEKYGKAMDSGFTMASWLTTTATAAAAEGVDADGDGKADDGTKKKETLQLIQQLNLTDQQKAFWYSGSSYNGEDKDKIQNAMSQGIPASTYIDAQIKLADAHGVDDNGDGKTDRGSKMTNEADIINSLPLSAERKKWLFLQVHSTSTKFADSYNWTSTG